MAKLPKPFIVVAFVLFRSAYDHLSLGRLFKALADRWEGRNEEPLTPLERSKVRAFFIDCLIVSRLVVALGMLSIATALPTGLVFIPVAISVLIVADVLLSHLVHMMDDSVGSAGPQARLSTQRSFVIALINVLVLLAAYATLFVSLSDESIARAIALSVSSVAISGVVSPEGRNAVGISLAATASGLFMLTVVLSTIVAGFRQRLSLEESSKKREAD